MQGKLEDGGIVSGPVAYNTALVLTSAFQRLWKEGGSDLTGWSLGIRWNSSMLPGLRGGLNGGRGGTLSYEGVPVAESDVC